MISDRICFPYQEDPSNIPQFMKDVRTVYDRMVDNISKDIFMNRLMFSLTGKHIYMKDVLLSTTGGRKLDTILTNSKKAIYIYGAGIRGKRLLELFPDKGWGGFIDLNQELKSYNGVKILDLDEFTNLYDYGIRVIISNMVGDKEIKKNLLKKGIDSNDILALNDFDQENANDIYFSTDCIGHPEKDMGNFIDIGCYDGKDSLRYLKWIDNSNAKIYAFEPDKKNYAVCKEILGKYPNIELFNIGLSDVEGELGIKSNGEMSYLEDEGTSKVSTQLLDNIILDYPVGFIKMDVEGYEENVLKGAKNVICNQHPILAVSIYHKKYDIWRIPNLLLNYYKDYYFYMRHYSVTYGDTVLYAVNKNQIYS